MPINLKIVTCGFFPHGMACTERLLNYARGITEAGGKVQVLIGKAPERDLDSAKNKVVRGTHKGVAFEYTCGTTVSAGLIKPIALQIKGVFKISAMLLRERKDIDAVLFAMINSTVVAYIALLCRALGILCLREVSEIAFLGVTPRSILRRVYEYLFQQMYYKLFDGLVVISNPLREYLKSRIRKTARLLLVPVIVDPEEFVNERRTPTTEKRSIALCGALSQRKDGVLTLIRAFKQVSDNLTDLTLYLIGGTPGHEDELKSRELVKELGLESKIVFTGYVSRDRLRQLMCDASVLALAKPSSLQADYCFPSKLAEYLATGNPVVVTDTGEISLYLEDGVNAFITAPDSDAAFAQRLEFVLSNPEIARQVGRRGQEVALSSFDYRIQAKRIMSFVQKLKSNHS